MKKAEMVVLGTRRITGMDVWYVDNLDMEVPAHITIRDKLTDEFQFGLMLGDLDARLCATDSVARLEFSWSAFDENAPMSDRGWMEVAGDRAQGHIFIHLGDDSAFAAVRAG